jgi:UDP-N-acetylglucosamine 2-epimerase
MPNNLNKRPKAQDAGTIILTGFEPETVLNSVRTVILEHEQLEAHSSQLKKPS